MKERILRILIVDDEEVLTLGYSKCLTKVGYEVKTAGSGEEAIKFLKDEMFDLVLLDIRLPHISGMEVLSKALEIDPDLIVIMITAHGSVQSAVDAMRMGAFDYLLKGFDHEELRTVVKKALDMYRLKREVSQLQENERKNYPDIAIFGTSPKIKYIKDLIKIVARTPKTSVLIEGESGTGKELVAKAVHNLSSRSDKPLIAINCSAIPENLMESELFGYEKGAFTDAKSLKKGVFELAHCGTLFLDEISSMKLSLQPKLLRVLETQSFRRIGGTSDIKIDVRIIAATNQNLKECVDNGSFREDLYYRLRVMVINLPPLRERVEDIVPMAKMFIEQNNKEFSKNIMGFSKEAEQLMLNFDWPGNVRELKNIMERAVILCQGNVVTEEYLPSELRSAKPKEPKPISYQSPTGEALSLQDIEQKHILEILEKFNGNKSKAARVLNISRSTLREKLKQYGIS